MILIAGIVLVAFLLLAVNILRTLRSEKSSCSACHSCPLPETERVQCAEAVADPDRMDA